MGASIFYRQVKPIKAKSLNVWASSSFISSMATAFGSFPILLQEEDILVLKGMSAMNADGGGDSYAVMIKAIKKYGAIEVYYEY